MIPYIETMSFRQYVAWVQGISKKTKWKRNRR